MNTFDSLGHYATLLVRFKGRCVLGVTTHNIRATYVNRKIKCQIAKTQNLRCKLKISPTYQQQQQQQYLKKQIFPTAKAKKPGMKAATFL